MNNEENKTNYRDQNIGALWEKGDDFYTGYVELDKKRYRIFMRGNRFKTDERHPSFHVYLTSEQYLNMLKARKEAASKSSKPKTTKNDDSTKSADPAPTVSEEMVKTEESEKAKEDIKADINL